MSYKLLYTNTAFKDIKKLDIVAKKRIGKKIEEFSKDPFSTSKKLVNSSIGSYRWRIGNYRVIYKILDNEKLTFLIIRIIT